MNTPMHISDPDFDPGGPLILPLQEVHVWRADLATVAGAEDRWQRLLSGDESARASRFHFSSDRQCYTATRALLRTLLGSYVNRDPRELVFAYTEKEKPYVHSTDPEEKIEFNVSHSGSRAMFAFARQREVGIDVEHIRADVDCEALARRFFSPAEQQELAAMPSAERHAGFFRCWTRKEAYIKAKGTGLSLPLHAFDVSLAGEERNALLATRPDSSEAAAWSLSGIAAGEGYEAALCVKGHGWVLKS